MATAVLDALKTMTLEEFLALPDDGMERMLIDGVLWEKAGQYRDRFHGSSAARIGKVLGNWAASISEPRPEIVGAAGFVLSKSPDHSTCVDIDVAVPPRLHLPGRRILPVSEAVIPRRGCG